MPEIKNPPDLIIVLGPTATGKTALAAALASKLGSEVISADSRQVYRGMTIGTGKDYADYIVQGRTVPYHLIDIMEAGTEYNLFQYQKDFLKVYESIRSKGNIPILCGGSGLYLQAVLKSYRLIAVPFNPDLRTELSEKTDRELAEILAGMKSLHNVSDTDTRKRMERAIEIAVYEKDHPDQMTFPEIRSVNFGIHFERSVIRERITERLRKRLNEGLVEEVETLMASGVSVEMLKYYGLEYKFVASFINGELSRDKMFEGLNIAIHQFAKRQMTWFRKMQREGMEIQWIDGTLSTESKIGRILSAISHIL
ncbi:MAG: tRNA dimethylallyltransferase [Syntrophus sp. SKADARSKE-3]|nr:tRNA dimethylallyltransferase [Syntrophus sp. SKADARSKE-3]